MDMQQLLVHFVIALFFWALDRLMKELDNE